MPILEALGVAVPVDRALLIEIDPALCSLLVALFSDPESIADDIDARSGTNARDEWARARGGTSPADVLLTIAGSRGGTRDGGFKGLHKLRASVDGFTPNRRALAARVREFTTVRGRVDVLCADAACVIASDYEATAVYIDPPYFGRRGYGQTLADPAGIARIWTEAGHRVVVSETFPLRGAVATHEITNLRAGQSRQRNSNDNTEWLSVFGGR